MRIAAGSIVCAVALTLVACAGGGASGPGTVPPPSAGPAPVATPTPTPGPVVTALSLNPSAMKLGGLSYATCPRPRPSGTWCLDGYSAVPVSANDPAAAVYFAPLTNGGGAYGAAVADPSIASVSQPFLGSDGREVFGVTPLKVGSTSVRVTAPNGTSATLPVVVTSLTIVLDFSDVPATTTYLPALNVAFPGGSTISYGGRSMEHFPDGPTFQGGTIVPVTNAPAYEGTSVADPTVPGQQRSTFEAAIGVSVSLGFYDPKSPVMPVSVRDGQSNTVTVKVPPPPF